MSNGSFDADTIYSGIADTLDSVDKDDPKKTLEVIGSLAEVCATSLNMLITSLGRTREVANALDRLDESWMWTTTEIRKSWNAINSTAKSEETDSE